jgi:hypothetical protein
MDVIKPFVMVLNVWLKLKKITKTNGEAEKGDTNFE